jgi:NAD(P)-dependent dehydrogenase (short-subunit alcohol dehydrogenase family)
MRVAVVLGANGGIGEAFTKEFLYDQEIDLVLVTFRHKTDSEILNQDLENLIRLTLQADKEEDFKKLANTLSEHPNGDLRYIVNCIGLLDSPTQKAEKRIEDFELGFFMENMISNASPIVLACKYLKKFIKTASRLQIVSLSARVGSISENKLGGWYSYRASKAAMNMLLKTLSLEMKWWNKNAKVYAIHPGTTETKLSKAYWEQACAKYQTHSPEESCKNILKVLQTEPESGSFYGWDAKPIAW